MLPFLNKSKSLDDGVGKILTFPSIFGNTELFEKLHTTIGLRTRAMMAIMLND